MEMSPESNDLSRRIAGDPVLHRRLAALARAAPPVFADPEFPQQWAFVNDKAYFRTAMCSRRSGKTMGCAGALLDTALKKSGSVNLYLTLSRKTARRIIWQTLKDLNREHDLGGIAHETELSLTLPSRSVIYLVGSKDKGEIEKYRGMPLGLVVIDEAQSFPAFIQDLVDSVLAPALMDHDGSLMLIGTPAPVPAGYFHDCHHNPEWSHHHWTVFDNPWIERKSGKPPMYHLEKEMKRRGVKITDSVVRREWFGEEREDSDSLVFKFDARRNTFRELPKASAPWEHVIGIDLGFEDADALAVIAFNEAFPNAYAVEEWAGRKQTITELAERTGKLIEKYKPRCIVWDTGGLGKKIADEVTRRTGIPLKAAEKSRKQEYIELLNDALRTGRMLFRPDSLFADDSRKIEWDRDKSGPDRRVVSSRFHSDIADAVLYGFRESLHWLHEPVVRPPSPGTPDWYAARDAAMEEEAERRACPDPDRAPGWEHDPEPG